MHACRHVDMKTLRQTASTEAERLPGELHVWQFDLRNHRGIGFEVCSESERGRARLFASRLHGIDFLVSRALTREVLGSYCGMAATELEFTSKERRKPNILGRSLPFNISHSGNQLAIAICSAGKVGVDIEQVRPLDELALARSVFDPSEVRFLQGIADGARQVQFFRLWVCREAILKLVGVGFEGRGLALGQNGVGNYSILARPSGWGEFEIAEFDGPPGFLGAVAWQPTASELKICHYKVS